MDACLNCSEPLKEPRKLKDFCSYACRGKHSVKVLDGAKYQTALIGSKNTRKTKALQSLKRLSVAGIAFVKINSITYRIDRPSKKAVGWLMEVAWSGGRSRQRWVACVGNHRSKPLPLEEAKQVAKELLNKPKAQPRDFIGALNQIAANEVDDAYWTRARLIQTACSVEGNGHIPLYRPKAKGLQNDDYPLTYDANGYPELPACLDRRPINLAEAA